jgi:hypothetical protein
MDYKIIIKPIKPRTKETDPIKLEAMKQKRKEKREANKNKPKPEPKEKVEKPPKEDTTEFIDNINKSLKNIIGFSIEEINDKIKQSAPKPVQMGMPELKPEKKVKEKKIKK